MQKNRDAARGFGRLRPWSCCMSPRYRGSVFVLSVGQTPVKSNPTKTSDVGYRSGDQSLNSSRKRFFPDTYVNMEMVPCAKSPFES